MIVRASAGNECLTAKSGEEFGLPYIDNEIKTHKKVIRLANETMNEADSHQLRQLLLRSRPILKDHLQGERLKGVSACKFLAGRPFIGP
ncbi:DUF4142 domain-containing protein [Nitrospira sp. Nam74]